MIKDLTIGKPSSVLWKLSMPMFISAIFQQMYSMADSIIAGKFAGEDALASVGVSFPITMLFIAIALGSNIGCSVIVSQFFGSKDYKNTKTAISTSIITCVTLSIILTLLGVVFSQNLLIMINTPNNIFSDSKLYLNIYILGFIFVYLYNIITGIFTSLGDSKTPLYFLIASSVGNIMLDYIFVAIFSWGVSGVAWATFIAQSVSAILSAIVLKKRLKQLPNVEYNHFSKSMLLHISKVAIPSILQQSFISVGNIFIQSIINSLSSSVIAGYSAAIKLNTFAITSFTTLANGLSSFTAQNVGAREFTRIKQGFKSGVVMVLVFAVPFFVSFFFLPDIFVSMFLDSDASAKALTTGVQFLKIVSPFYLIISIKLMADAVLRGSSSMGYFMVATFSDLILRVALAYVLVVPFGAIGIWSSWPIGWSTAMAMSVYFCLSNKWQAKWLNKV